MLVNVRLLERAIKFCKQLLKNEHSEYHMNDLVKDEIKPKDFSFGKTYNSLHNPRVRSISNSSEHLSSSLTRMYSEKYWQQLV